MLEYKYRCDGCNAYMSEEETRSSLALAADVAKQWQEGGRDYSIILHPQTLVAVSHFCNVCQVSAPAYWQEQVEFNRSLLEEMNTRLLRFRKNFFEGRKRHALKIVKGATKPELALAEVVQTGSA